MTFEGYGAFDDPYVYKGTSVLKNKLKIRNAAALSAFEVEMSTARAAEPLPAGRFGTAHYRAVHRHLFQDVYRWAGRYRTIRTGKGGNWFCFPEYIPREMERVFGNLKRDDLLKGRAFNDFSAGAAAFLAELNAIHPFREGNGRAQLSFLYMLAGEAGHLFDLSRIRPDKILAAMVASFGGDTGPLVHEIVRLRP
jgi:cell filamentation protein, protein adenylyltransferase